MAISLNPRHLKRYSQIARMLVKYGRSDLVKGAGLEAALEEVEPSSNGNAMTEMQPSEEGIELANDLEQMGPTYVKLGQLLSTRTDLLPPPYIASLARLQDDIEPFPFAQVDEIICTELGVRLSKAFDSFEEEPIAAASLGQVHRARLRTGRMVAVKVQRPGIREQIATDMEALQEIAEFLDSHTETGRRFDFKAMLDEFRRSLLRELDYQKEADHLRIIGENLRDFDRIIIPEPVADYTTGRVLTMDYVRGRKITELSPLARMEMDGEELAETLFRAYLKQILVDGIFHADPHPGNVFITEDRHIALIDLGMVGRIAPVMQEQLLKLLLAISEGKAEEAADIAIKLGQPMDRFDEKNFVREVSQLVAQHHNETVEQIDAGRVILEMTRSAGAHDIRPPAELSLLGKTLLNLDIVARTLAPHFQPNEAVRRNASEVLRHRLKKSLSPGNWFSTMLELNEFAQTLPSRVNRVLDRVADNQISVKVDAIDETELIGGIQKIANRITLGLILAALIIGAALLMRVETNFRIMGYPGIAMLLFLAAACGGGVLAWNIVFHDRHRKQG
jgi:predicted unusual protein kinase regulating ubiquinone biosynthesis (AarF/ABC1/UbiB family)